MGFIDRVGVLVSAGKLAVHAVTAEDESRAWRWLRRHDEREYSFVDAASFEVMRARRLREALAFDNDFADGRILRDAALTRLAHREHVRELDDGT